MSNYDFWASHAFFDSPQISERAAVDYLLSGRSNPYPHHIPDLSARVLLSALALLGDKEYARTGTRRETGGLHELYKRQSFQNYLYEQWQQCAGLMALSPDLSLLPAGSFSISFRFTLTSPYLSKDDAALHLLDNPVKKDWVFKLPYIASTQWKGALRAAVRQINNWGNQDSQLLRLFGEANDNKPDEGKSGRLYFYPTFFDRLSLEVINPHDRKTGAGSQPILMECVPAGTTGAFTLLYTPLDRIGQDAAETRRHVFADLQLLAQGLEALFTVYGFGAKTSSGFGLADNAVGDGEIIVGGLARKAELPAPETASSTSPQPELPRYLNASGRLHPDFVAEAGGLKHEAEYQKLVEGRGHSYGKKDKQLYDKAKSWWEREGQQLARQQQELAPEPKPVPVAPPSYLLVRETFDAFENLPAKAQKLADTLRQAGGEA